MDGRKTVEVRRTRVSAPAGTLIVLYATSPVKALVATARLQDRKICSANDAWAEFGALMGLERHELDAYVGLDEACFLLLDQIQAVDRPIPLADLTSTSSFRPPQSYRYVSPTDPEQLRMLISPEVGRGARRLEPAPALARDEAFVWPRLRAVSVVGMESSSG
jgi:predicted transcriptional regulator